MQAANSPNQPIGGPNLNAKNFFQEFLAAPLILAFYLFWKIYSVFSKNPKINYRGWKLFLHADEIDIISGTRPGVLLTEEQQAERRAERERRTWLDRILYVPKQLIYALFV